MKKYMYNLEHHEELNDGPESPICFWSFDSVMVVYGKKYEC